MQSLVNLISISSSRHSALWGSSSVKKTFKLNTHETRASSFLPHWLQLCWGHTSYYYHHNLISVSFIWTTDNNKKKFPNASDMIEIRVGEPTLPNCCSVISNFKNRCLFPFKNLHDQFCYKSSNKYNSTLIASSWPTTFTNEASMLDLFSCLVWKKSHNGFSALRY